MSAVDLPPARSTSQKLGVLLRVVTVLGLLYGFLVAIQLMSGSIKLMGKDTAKNLFEGVDNPFAALAVGILATVLVQSSSTTTATIVSLVGAAKDTALSVKTAVPMIMGANVGTTITNTLVSVGHVRRSLEFKRAFAVATVHDFFNLLLVAIMLPIELMTGVLSSTAEKLTKVFYGAHGAKIDSPVKTAVKASYKAVVGVFEGVGLEGIALAVVVLLCGIAMTMVCLVFITKNMRVLISGPLERALNKSLGRSGLIGIVVGALVTIAVQSSSITTSLLVPMSAAGVLSIQNAFPIMLGANIGTTVTGLLASVATDENGLTIAIVHTLFNVSGVLIFYPIPAVRNIPIRLANGLAEKASRNPLWVIGYVVGVFVILPLSGYLLFKHS